MSSFQSTVRFDLGFGVVGEIRLGYPVKAQTGVLSSTNAANNVIGRVFTQTPATGLWAAGNVGAAGVSPSVLAIPKDQTTSGGASGSLSPSMTLPNLTSALFVSAGFINVSLLTTVNPSLGDDLHYQEADGQIIAVAPGTAPAVGNLVLSLGGVYMFPQPAVNGMCIANLRN